MTTQNSLLTIEHLVLSHYVQEWVIYPIIWHGPVADNGYSAFHNHNNTWLGPGPFDNPNLPLQQALDLI